MLNNRNIISLIAHVTATVIAIWIATVLTSQSADMFGDGTDIGEMGAGIFSLILWIIAAIWIIIALLPFIAVAVGWTAFFSRVSWLTLTSAILYACASLLFTEGGYSLSFLLPAALAFVGWLQERKSKRPAPQSEN